MSGKLASESPRFDGELLGLKMRRSPHLVMYFHRGRLVVENYLMRRTFLVDSNSLTLLGYFSNWRTASDASRRFGNYTQESIFRSIQSLRAAGLLTGKGSSEEKLENKFGRDWLWPRASRYYHFSTKIGDPHNSPREIRRYFERYLEGRKQPLIYKTYPRQPKIRLERASGREAPFFRTLQSRRSMRELSGKPVGFNDLSKLLYYTWGRMATYRTSEFGELLHKTSPSAGARHPIETYAIVNNVNGLERGIYHYSVRDNSLELLKPGDFKDTCVALTAGHQWTRDSSALFIMTAVVARTAWKYRLPRVYRAFLLDAGHLSQSFLLVATALGLAGFCIGTFSDDLIEKELGLDGISETVIFVVGVGQPLKRRFAADRTLPRSRSQLQSNGA